MNAHFLPLIDEIFNILNASPFSTLDLYSGNYQIHMDPGGINITTFSTIHC